MIPKIKVEFCLTGTQKSPEEITGLLGITPTRIFRLGDSIQNTASKYKVNGWCFSISGYQNTYYLEESISMLLDQIIPFSERIIQVCVENGLYSEISCAVYLADETPCINFSQRTITRLNELKTTVDVDLILTESPD